jgi:hypothetical protein
MGIVNLADKVSLDGYNDMIFQDPDSFLQQTTLWAETVAPIADDKVICFEIKTKSYFISCTMYLFSSEVGSYLVSNVQAGSIGCIAYIGDNLSKREAYGRIIDEIVKFARNNKCIGVSLTTNPYSNDNALLRDYFEPDAGMETFISVIDIEKYFDENGQVTFADYNYRTNLSRNIKKGYQSGFNFNIDSTFNDLENWYENIHKKRILELNGKPLPWSLFHNISTNAALNPYTIFFTVYKEDKLIGGDLCIFAPNGNLDNFMMSTDSDYLKDGLNFFLVDNIIKWCYKNNIRRYNWQSSNPPQGGIFNFKKSWGSEVLPYFYYTKILDKKSFEQMINGIPFSDFMKTIEGHFVAPYQTIKAGQYNILNKLEINKLANIYQ